MDVSPGCSIALETLASEYRAACTSAGVVDRSHRARLSVAGPDRAKFLHNLTTNEVKRLAVSHGCEAFVTSLQGKTLGLATIHVLEDRLILRTDAAAVDLVAPHLEKYSLFDDVQIENETEKTFELHIIGPRADELFRLFSGGAAGPETESGIIEFALDSIQLRAIRESPTAHPGFTLIGPCVTKADVLGRLKTAGREFGLVEISGQTFDVLRIEAGTPEFGRDLTEKNLPQELARDDRTISFVKGCYLGQETVARIDALGHVNQMLRAFRPTSQTDRLTPGDLIKVDDKPIGRLTSTAFSPGWNCWIALGYLRESARGASQPFSTFSEDGEEAARVTMHDPPMAPPDRA